MLPSHWIYARYLLASGVALTSDMGTYVLLLRLGGSPVSSAVLGYAAGIIVHWLLSTRFVFSRSSSLKGSERWQAKMLFALTAAMGLAVTAGIVALGIQAGLPPIPAKLVAIAVSFNVTYVARRWLVFPA